ncbi:hypothetical protein O1611_g7228 [Lasiodiplodia mahajangana]|uniref:Uncharacterized protein n=1 Tax=Lasiodiplodia mahajangana TaxID=1108764 RepID=A0ACC2JFZ1_9PEZI|nr:hypothetical protein O1611_g7228 [Lasiodiplodia mahajangana]
MLPSREDMASDLACPPTQDNMGSADVKAEKGGSICGICRRDRVRAPFPLRTTLSFHINDALYSASLVGAGRLSRAVMYYLSNDNLYNVSSVFLWCTAELSIAFLVFCLPAIPKIFSGNKWIKRSTTRLYLRLGFKKTRASEIPASDEKVTTWNSSKFSRDVTLETGWDQYPNLPNPQHAHVAPYSTLGVYTTDATKSYSPYANIHAGSGPYAQSTWPGAWSNHHDPSTSWYEA